jgi:hypothetical protein
VVDDVSRADVHALKLSLSVPRGDARQDLGSRQRVEVDEARPAVELAKDVIRDHARLPRHQRERLLFGRLEASHQAEQGTEQSRVSPVRAVRELGEREMRGERFHESLRALVRGVPPVAAVRAGVAERNDVRHVEPHGDGSGGVRSHRIPSGHGAERSTRKDGEKGPRRHEKSRRGHPVAAARDDESERGRAPAEQEDDRRRHRPRANGRNDDEHPGEREKRESRASQHDAFPEVRRARAERERAALRDGRIRHDEPEVMKANQTHGQDEPARAREQQEAASDPRAARVAAVPRRQSEESERSERQRSHELERRLGANQHESDGGEREQRDERPAWSRRGVDGAARDEDRRAAGERGERRLHAARAPIEKRQPRSEQYRRPERAGRGILEGKPRDEGDRQRTEEQTRYPTENGRRDTRRPFQEAEQEDEGEAAALLHHEPVVVFDPSARRKSMGGPVGDVAVVVPSGGKLRRRERGRGENPERRAEQSGARVLPPNSGDARRVEC